MSEEESDEELPPISMNSSTSNSDTLCMPTAEMLASQRAREAECERELLSLRAQHEAASHTDSSGSEGEAALAAAVNALLVGGGGGGGGCGAGAGAGAGAPSAAAPLPALRTLLATLAHGHLPALSQASADMLDMLTDDICAAVEWGRVRAEQEVVFAAAWLCASGAGAAAGGGRARRARRALHLLMDTHYFRSVGEESFGSLAKALIDTKEPVDMRLEMADVLSSAEHADERLPRLALALAAAALAAALPAPAPAPQMASIGPCLCEWSWTAVSRGWGAGAGAGAGAAAARLLALCPRAPACAAPRRALLQRVTAPPPPRRRHTPHALEMLVNARKLQLLIRQ